MYTPPHKPASVWPHAMEWLYTAPVAALQQHRVPGFVTSCSSQPQRLCLLHTLHASATWQVPWLLATADTASRSACGCISRPEKASCTDLAGRKHREVRAMPHTCTYCTAALGQCCVHAMKRQLPAMRLDYICKGCRKQHAESGATGTATRCAACDSA